MLKQLVNLTLPSSSPPPVARRRSNVSEPFLSSRNIISYDNLIVFYRIIRSGRILLYDKRLAGNNINNDIIIIVKEVRRLRRFYNVLSAAPPPTRSRFALRAPHSTAVTYYYYTLPRPRDLPVATTK